MDQPSGKNPPEVWLSADEATSLLGIKRASLYAYVSRGLVRARTIPGTRDRQYLKADLDRLRVRRDARRGHTAVAASALDWGEPVLDSRLTEIRPDGHRYRGRSAIELALADAPFEHVANWLLHGVPSALDVDPIDVHQSDDPVPWDAIRRLLASHERTVRLFDAQSLALQMLAVGDPDRGDLSSQAALRVASRITRALAMAPGLLRDGAARAEAARERTVAAALTRAIGADSGDAMAVLAVNRALVLTIDHELNPSSFTARVTASAGADLHASVIAALATFSGIRHGTASTAIEELVDEIGEPERTARVIRERARKGEAIPGFGHRLYPAGDPRTEPLLEVAERVGPTSVRRRVLTAVIDTMELLGAERPTVDVGLLGVAFALGLGAEAAQAIFATGRAAGWIAHALEQATSGESLRPRARYAGELARRDGTDPERDGTDPERDS